MPISIHKEKSSVLRVSDCRFKLGDVFHRPPVDFLDHVTLLQAGAGCRAAWGDFADHHTRGAGRKVQAPCDLGGQVFDRGPF